LVEKEVKNDVLNKYFERHDQFTHSSRYTVVEQNLSSDNQQMMLDVSMGKNVQINWKLHHPKSQRKEQYLARSPKYYKQKSPISPTKTNRSKLCRLYL
jgi:hypothetical protein